MFQSVQIREYERGLLYRAGRYVRTGSRRAATRIWQAFRHESVTVVDEPAG